jgi:hypothetical protein
VIAASSTWISGLFVLLGVLVGVVLNALSTAYLEGHRNLASARVAARLVREDLRETHSRASASVNVGMYGPEANEGA